MLFAGENREPDSPSVGRVRIAIQPGCAPGVQKPHHKGFVVPCHSEQTFCENHRLAARTFDELQQRLGCERPEMAYIERS